MKKFLILALVTIFSAAAWSAETQINVPYQEHAAVLEQIAEPNHLFWQQAARLYGMTEFVKGNMAKNDSSIAMVATDDALYIQVIASMPIGHQLRMAEKNRDGKVYFDDCVEIALALPGKKADEYFQITINPANVLYDAYRVNRSWNGKLTTATRIKNDCWVATFRIPFTDLGLKGRPDELKFNMARTLCGNNMEQTVLVRNHVGLYFGNLQDAVVLKFGKELPAVNLDKLVSENGGVRARAVVLPEEKFADFNLKVFDLKGKKVADVTGQARFDSKQSDLPLPPLADGRYFVEFTMIQAREYIIPAYYGGGKEPNPRLQAGQTPQTYFVHRWPLTVDNAPMINADVKLRDTGHTLKALIRPRAVICSDQAVYNISIRTVDGRTVKKFPAAGFKTTPLEITGDIKELPARTRYILHVELFDGGEVLLSCDTPFATPPRPDWNAQQNPDRPDVNKVPAPWTPVELDKLTAKCWNREYHFAADSLLPQQIVSGKVELLAAPARVVSKPEIKWALVKAARLNNSTVRFDYIGKTAAGVEVKAYSELYYDGVVRTDLEIPANAVFSELYLELPYKKDVALFSHQGPGIFGGIFNVRSISKSEKYTFIPNYMLVNDDVGLGWFDGMPFNWPLKDVTRVVEMTPQSDRTTVRINYIDNDKSYPVARRYSWGLQSFPVRPMPEKEEAMRLCYIIRYGDEDRPAWFSQIEYFAYGNIDIKQGSAEIKFMVPENCGEDFILQSRHGDASEILLMTDAGGFLRLCEREYWTTRWNLKSKQPLKPGVWYHAAFSWGNGQIEFYLNGELQGSVAREQLQRHAPTRLLVGGKKITADELHITKNPRKSFAVNKAPEVQADTLLCDNFDAFGYCNGRRATVPLKVDREAEAGYLMFDANIVDGIRGKAIGPMTVPVSNMIEGYARMGVQAMCYHASQYTDEAFAGLYIKDEKRFRRSVAEIHKNNMKAIIYVGNSVSNFDRLFDTYADDWLIEPRGVPFVTPRVPNEKGYQACPRSNYIEYFYYRIGKLIDEYKLDGIFLDGRMESECRNERHGCGIRNFDGELVAQRDVWDGLYKARYLYNVFENRNCYGEQHKSGNWNIPACFYWDGVWEGEQTMGVSLNGRRKLDFYPLEAMRGEINGIPYGMPSRNTAYTYAPFSPLENCTYSFVHGTTWTMTYRMEEGLVVSPYWLMQDKFGANKHNFLPYWAKRPPAKAICSDLLKISAHVKPGEVLIMAANFDEDREFIQGKVTLDLATLKIKKPILREAFSGREIPIAADGSFEIKVRSFRQEWFLLTEK